MKALFFLSLLPAVVFSFEAITDDNIKQAVKEWIDNPDDALDMYGEISLWDTSQVTDMIALFYNMRTFNDDITKWNVANVKYMPSLFGGASAFNQGISKWNVANVNDMGFMFHGASAFNQDISGWNVAKVKSMFLMFYEATTFNQDLCAWGSKLQSGSNIQAMFDYASSCPTTDEPSLTGATAGPFCHTCGSKVEVAIGALTDDNIHHAVKEWIDNPDDAFDVYGEISLWDTSQVTDMN